jgi:hypothetical protein
MRRASSDAGSLVDAGARVGGASAECAGARVGGASAEGA